MRPLVDWRKKDDKEDSEEIEKVYDKVARSTCEFIYVATRMRRK